MTSMISSDRKFVGVEFSSVIEIFPLPESSLWGYTLINTKNGKKNLIN
jgi:hypothetical protein